MHELVDIKIERFVPFFKLQTLLFFKKLSKNVCQFVYEKDMPQLGHFFEGNQQTKNVGRAVCFTVTTTTSTLFIFSLLLPLFNYTFLCKPFFDGDFKKSKAKTT